jgi:uncharacterized protein YkwD
MPRIRVRPRLTVLPGRVSVSVAAVMVVVAAALPLAAGTARADNTRLNNSVVANVYTVQHQAGCTNDVRMDARLQAAAQRHVDDLMANRNLFGDTGSDGSTVVDRARASGFPGAVAETVATNPAIAISGIDILNQWYYDPTDLAIMQDCTHTRMGVWSENSIDRTVVVAVYGTA